MNLVKHFLSQSNELSQTEIQPPVSNEIFSEFGFDEQRFITESSEYYYQHLLESVDAELSAEQQTYNAPELYSGGSFFGDKSGPNCYAFALKEPKNPMSGEVYNRRPFPGMFSHGNRESIYILEDVLENGSTQEQKNLLSKLIMDDAEQLGLDMREVDADYNPQQDEWIIAMVATPSDNSSQPSDFHFYRKGENDVWLHKQGITEVKNTDASGNLIYDPAKCNRGGYDNFLGYYVVRAMR